VTVPEELVVEVAAIIAYLLDPRPFPQYARETELEKGNYVVAPGDLFLSRDDWEDDVVVSVAGDEARIVLVRARRPFTGAFHRLLDAIAACNLKPVVVSPLPLLESMLERWGWEATIVGTSWANCEEQWRPKP
jgi:hypothetical protein